MRGTESGESVRKALENLFPGEEVVEREGRLVVESKKRESLENLREMVWSRRILESVRSRLRKGGMTLLLNKQAAFAGRIALCENEGESPLGAISVSFSRKHLDWFSPHTEGGKPV